MRVDTLTSRARLAVNVARQARRSAVRQLQQSRLLRWRYGGPSVDQLLLVPHDLRTADPSFATEIYHGHFGLAGAIALTGSESPFAMMPPTLEWQRELHGFGWLRHLRVGDDDISREHARALVRDWMAIHGTIGGLPWQADILARRIISWLSHATIVLEGAEPRFYDAVMDSLTRQIRYLRATHGDVPDGAPRLVTLTALLLAGLCAPDEPDAAEPYVTPFSNELNAQILVDGGHVSRNPGVLVDLLLDLLPLRQCFVARDLMTPPALTQAVDRMMPMIRFFRLGDGALARFNGMSNTLTDALANVLAYDDVQGRPVSEASQSGYFRLHRGNTIVIADMGETPPGTISQSAHAGTLSFEMSTGLDPLIVNCGAARPGKEDWQLVARSTAAHSTVSVCDTSSAHFVATPLLGESVNAARLVGPPHVTAHIEHESGGAIVEGSHDGYEKRFGIVHKRRLTLTTAGDQLTGEDSLHAPSGLTEAAQTSGGAFAIRFHLHPDIAAELSPDAHMAVLTLPDNRDVWRLVSEDLPLSLEESIFLANNMRERQTSQIVINGALGEADEVRVTWRVEKHVGPLAGVAGRAVAGTRAGTRLDKPDSDPARAETETTTEDVDSPDETDAAETNPVVAGPTESSGAAEKDDIFVEADAQDAREENARDGGESGPEDGGDDEPGSAPPPAG